jgi:hypothetical protein
MLGSFFGTQIRLFSEAQRVSSYTKSTASMPSMVRFHGSTITHSNRAECQRWSAVRMRSGLLRPPSTQSSGSKS